MSEPGLGGVCEECYYAAEVSCGTVVCHHSGVATGDDDNLTRPLDWFCEHFMPRDPSRVLCSSCYWRDEDAGGVRCVADEARKVVLGGCAKFMLNRHKK